MYALQHFYLPSLVHSRFINQKVLQRYMPVGGVRIEDDILITSRGYENLTKAPKGDAMFDIIRGRKSALSTAQQRRNANPPTSVSEPSLFRAPGCPLRATPPGLHSTKRAATMPNQINLDSQRAEVDRQNYAMHFRRSMTTDERVRHWRQSHQQPFPRRPTAIQEKPNTMCGIFANDVKHIYIGDGNFDTSSTHSLPKCTDCAILAQTLQRLRQNLASSKQSSPTQTHIPQEAFGTSAAEAMSPRSAGQDTNEPSKETVSTPINTPQQDNHSRVVRTVQGSGLTGQARAKNSLPQLLQLQEMQPDQLRATVFTLPEALSCQEPESYYRSHEQCQDPVQQQLVAERTNPTTHERILRSRMSMPMRPRMAQLQEGRRPSNHTDDRDWMA
jgi:Xaa-Pro dipeptidase